jgi:hypothetical protein
MFLRSLMNVGLYLFIWGSFNRREKAIKDLLARSGHKLDNWTALGLAGTLKLPMPWIDEAKVSISSPPALIITCIYFMSLGTACS